MIRAIFSSIFAAALVMTYLTACSTPNQTTVDAASVSSIALYQRLSSMSPEARTAAYQTIAQMSLGEFYSALEERAATEPAVLDGVALGISRQNLLAQKAQLLGLSSHFATVGAVWQAMHWSPETWTLEDYLSAIHADTAAQLALAGSQLTTHFMFDFCFNSDTYMWNHFQLLATDLAPSLDLSTHPIVGPQILRYRVGPSAANNLYAENGTLYIGPYGGQAVETDNGAYYKNCTTSRHDGQADSNGSPPNSDSPLLHGLSPSKAAGGGVSHDLAD